MAREKSPQSQLLERVKNDFAGAPADFARLAQKVAKTLPMGREQSLVLTKLEEAAFFASAAVTRQPAASSDAPARDVDGRAAKKAAAKAAPVKSTRRVTRTART